MILASASPRRRELLEQIGVIPDEIRPPDIDESAHRGEMPLVYCKRIVAEKARAVLRAPGEVVLVADTTVALGRRILGKPEDEKEAAQFLIALSGRRHRVITALGVVSDAGPRFKHVESTVKMKRLSDNELNDYLASDDWRGKAGGYAIQGPAGAFIPWISGSYSAIMGLPVFETSQMLRAAGCRVGGALA